MSDLHFCDRCKGIGPCAGSIEALSTLLPQFSTPGYVGIPIEVRRKEPCRHCTECQLGRTLHTVHTDAPPIWIKGRPVKMRRNYRGVKTYACWVSGDCPMCAAAQKERAAIVAWLRDEETWRRVARGNLAVFIERGEHLRGDE